MALIEFKDLPDTTTPITADNLNNNFEELNNRSIYSFNEIVIGTFVDGRPIYRKTVYISSYPNASEVMYDVGLINVDFTINVYGNANNLIVNGARSANPQGAIDAFVENNLLKIATGNVDRSLHSGYIHIEYVKTTD